ncbi:MAG: twin-arginine translocase TatA/TatE family subunit [Zymomonas mobilis subsp. pomaceae]|uniref:Sec-independent protein translocase protein TatA n=1 Tax=Zymomonas mobilis subsp. pomaceae (strain ATCC 29192 / DSM 22645 / JCM 10191 / CCUG 17912 / NBRC 13757 / NCIMB 11200 / NRRL B-4491 / Barker I) TaxID=579138 RepID=F8ETA1_ZYMMT|nr:twin-arginine translocase TatA/TatE family subunit [Zymomonas mobilis]AEI36991.1 twin-arginine translocation protein, TatA/E family subunit [Zymomonas mobilis subsp. pomaceae ATCC 29192]MDX5948364.1 twin-arginine translocase TatA/TatE family subunit [Zymomonas mobilis subsp. pomaceae]GEB89648.1 Sec-independent protein translocase protein TatA [Zymomonas mobilis subsp. pomaceae]
MGGMSITHWIIVAVVVMILFGKGRFSDMMGDVAKGIKSFKKGMAEDDSTPPAPPVAPAPRLENQPLPPETNSTTTVQGTKEERR